MAQVLGLVLCLWLLFDDESFLLLLWVKISSQRGLMGIGRNSWSTQLGRSFLPPGTSSNSQVCRGGEKQCCHISLLLCFSLHLFYFKTNFKTCICFSEECCLNHRMAEVWSKPSTWTSSLAWAVKQCNNLGTERTGSSILLWQANEVSRCG